MSKIGIAVWVLLIIAFLGLSAGVQAQSDEGLVAEWHFDEGSGSVVKDSSGNGNDGIIYGASWVDGKFGKALSFDGVDDYVEVPDSPSLDITDEITVELWVNPTTLGDCDLLVHKINAYGIGYSFVNYPAILGDRNKFDFHRLQANPPDYWACSNSVNSPIPGNWYHVIGTFDGTQHKIYVNGNLEGTVSFTGSFFTTDYPLIFGGYFYHIIPNHPQKALQKYLFDGIIDEVRIYNRALTADEIKSHYEGKQTALSLTKSTAPHSIKQGQTTTVTLTVKNTGTTEITDIEVSDTIPSDLTFISGETSKTYTSLRPNDSREYQYILQLNEGGTFNLDPATATYADEEGNYHTAESKTTAITAIPSTDQSTTPQTAPKSSTEISTASVHLHGEKTDVVMGEDILLKLAAVNLITKPTMHVQVIITPPSGMSVTSSEFVQSGACLFTASYEIEPGVGRDIEVRMRSNQVGDFVVNGRIVYYFGDDMDEAEDHTLTLPITVRAEPEQTADTSVSEEKGSSTPGFGAVVAVIGVFLVALLIKRRRLR